MASPPPILGSSHLARRLAIGGKVAGLVHAIRVAKALGYEQVSKYLVSVSPESNVPTVTSFRLFCLAQLINHGVSVWTVPG